MDIKAEYYLSKYEELKVLSDTEKCKTTMVRNVDTGELAVKKEMGEEAFGVYDILKTIDNKNMSKVYECFKKEDKCITIEEYVNGKRLESVIGENGISIKDTIDYGLQLCNALSDIHKTGIVHRDIQPKNIIITTEGILKLIDFDIAREEKENAERDTSLFGTVGYASPEQYGFAQTDCRSDIYSMGILMKEMATGLKNGDDEIIIKKLSKENFENDTRINGMKLTEIISKCIQIDAGNRYSDVEHLKLALQECGGVKTTVNYFEKCNELINKVKDEKSKENLNQLPELTFKNIFFSIPGFKSKNPIFAMLAILIYGMVAYVFLEMGLEVPVAGWRKVYSVIMYTVLWLVPYLYLSNIGQIAQRLPKLEFKSKTVLILFQILYGFILFFVIGCVIAFTLPNLNAN